MRRKVYCTGCRYYDGGKDCFAPRNMQEVTTWHSIKMVPIDPPMYRNRNNDCKDFKEVVKANERKGLPEKDQGQHD